MQAPSAAFERLNWLPLSQFIVQITQCEIKHTVETNLTHVSQLIVFIWMISSDGNSKMEPLQTIPLHWKTRSETYFKSLMLSFWNFGRPALKLLLRGQLHTHLNVERNLESVLNAAIYRYPCIFPNFQISIMLKIECRTMLYIKRDWQLSNLRKFSTSMKLAATSWNMHQWNIQSDWFIWCVNTYFIMQY